MLNSCRDRNATLAVYDDPFINAAIVGNGSSYKDLFLGYKCHSSEECVAETGTQISASRYFYGGAAMPSTGKCVMLETAGILAGKWISVNCNKKMAFVCGFSAVDRMSKCGVPYHLIPPVAITSMNYPELYDKNQNCAYFLDGGPFTLTFHSFQTERFFDYLAIYEVRNGEWLQVISLDGEILCPYHLEINSTAARLLFLTDGSVHQKGFSGTAKLLSCKEGYTLTHGYCWMIDTEEYTHYYAKQACRDRAATLAVYDDPEVNNAIVSSAKNHTNLWVGLKCHSKEECETDTGSITNSSIFFYRAPTPSTGRCTMMMTVGVLAGKWISANCNEKMAFVCGYAAVG